MLGVLVSRLLKRISLIVKEKKGCMYVKERRETLGGLHSLMG